MKRIKLRLIPILLLGIGLVVLISFFSNPLKLLLSSWFLEFFTPEWVKVFAYKVLNWVRSGASIIVFVWIGNRVVFQRIDFQKAILGAKQDKATYAKCVTAIVVALIIAAGLTSNSVHGASRFESEYNRYRTYIIGICYEQYAHSIDCPGLTAAQIHQESLWNPTAKSWVAHGMMQFTKRTWQGEINKYPEPLDIYDPYNNIRVGIGYQASLYFSRRLAGHYTKVPKTKAFPHRYAAALAGYNGGLGWVLKAIKQAGSKGWMFMTQSSKFFESQFPKHRAERYGYWRNIYRHYNRYYRSLGYPKLIFPT